jgi:hypothetical protein
MIKISKDGIEVSHNRYLTDSSTGLIFYLNIVLLNKFSIFKVVFLSNVIDKNFLSTDIFIVVLLFFLVTTFGLIISVLSWTFLEHIYVRFFEKFWWENKYPLKFIQFASKFTDIISSMRISYSNWHSSIVIAEEYLELNGININRFLIQRGVRVFIRNLSFLLVLNAILFLFKSTLLCSLISLCCSILFLLISGLIGFFSNVGLIVKYEMVKKTMA